MYWMFHDGCAARLQDAKKLQRSGQSLGVGFRSPLRQASDVRSLSRSGLWRGASEASSSQPTTELRCSPHRCHPPVAMHGQYLARCTQQPPCFQRLMSVQLYCSALNRTQTALYRREGIGT